MTPPNAGVWSRWVVRLCCACVVLGLAFAPGAAEVATCRVGAPRKARGAEARPERGKPPAHHVPATATAPALDGKLDDEVWATAPVLSLARTLDGGGRAAQPTEVRLLRDAKTLYVAARCGEPRLDKLRGAPRPHDGEIWGDDSLEIFLGVAGSGLYCHFGVNAWGSTYDAQVKDAAWNAGLRAAAAKEKDAWTVELAIPLAGMAGQGPAPAEWVANFNRNRYASGALEESAWSPTLCGDSHVPERFGRLFFKDPPGNSGTDQTSGLSPNFPGPGLGKPGPVKILPFKGGEGVAVFELSAVPKGANVLRADLVISRTAEITGQDDEALADLAVFPLFEESSEGAAPPAAANALAPRGPWFDRLDATEAVRQWVRGKPNGGFFVKSCPRWDAEGSYLDVAYEGTAAAGAAPQVRGVKAFHRSGQTFITWQEIEDRAGKDQVTWGGMRAILESLDREREVRYRVYRGERPITAATLAEAEPLAVVKPLSGWNLNGRNIERPIDEVIGTREAFPCGQWNPFGSAAVNGDFGRDCPLDRLVIREGDGPLPRNAGLYVHTASGPAKAYYAVVTCVDGVENTAQFSEQNATSEPVEETPGEPEPVPQRELPRMPFFNYAGRRLHYVHWVGPPYGNLPSQYYNWSVGVPEDLGKGVPLELSLPRDGHSYWRTQYRIERDSVVLCPHDFPLQTWWYGYHECFGTLRSFRQGSVQPYTERRLLAFVDWAARTWPVDRNRVLVTGSRGGASGSGALHLGLRHPEVFSLVIAGHPIVDYREAASRRGDRQTAWIGQSMESVWGKAEWGLKTDGGKSVWDEHDLIRHVVDLAPAAETPLLSINSSENDAACRRFYKALLDSGRAILAEFEWGGGRIIPVTATETFPNAVRLDVRRNRSLLAFRYAEALKLVTQGGMGEFNRGLGWRGDDLVDEADRYEVTIRPAGRAPPSADVTLRRLQKFHVEGGKLYHWTNRGADGKTVLQEGDVTIGPDGLLTIRDFKVVAGGSRLIVVPR